MTDSALIKLDRARQMLADARTAPEIKKVIDLAEQARLYAKRKKMGLEAQNYAAEIHLDSLRKFGDVLKQLGRDKAHGGGAGRGKKTMSNNGHGFSEFHAVLEETCTSRQDASRIQKIADIPDKIYAEHKEEIKANNKELTTSDMLHLAKLIHKKESKPKVKSMPPAERSPRLIVGSADHITLDDECIDMIITSPPYNLGKQKWPMGGEGRIPRENGIGYDKHSDARREDKYQLWQVACLNEMYRVAKQGASLFYNHKVRQHNGSLIHPMQWIGLSKWTIRQEIIWDRGSTHNHTASLFWQHDERIYWLTKGDPVLPDHPIGHPTILQIPFQVESWHPAPFPEDLPRLFLEAVGREGMTVLDPFAGSCTTLKAALKLGFDAIGIDISRKYLDTARKENGWTK